MQGLHRRPSILYPLLLSSRALRHPLVSVKYSREFQVGLAIVLAAVIFFFGVRYFADQPFFGGSYTLYTSFQDASGIAPGNAVFINGVKVGTVESVDLDLQEDAVRVAFSMEGDVRVPQGSHTAVAGLSFLGTSSMTVRLGPPGNPSVEPGSFIPSEDAGGGLTDLTAQAPALAARADSVLLNANVALSSIGRQLSNPQSDVQQTLQALRSAAAQMDRLLEEERGTLGQTLANLEAVSAEVRELGESDSLAHTVDRLNAVLLRLNSNLGQIEATTSRLDGILAKVDEGRGTLGLLVNDPSLYHELDSTARRINRLVAEFQENPKRYLQHLNLIEVF